VSVRFGCTARKRDDLGVPPAELARPGLVALRGLWATQSVESGAACESVAAVLGHGSFAVTAKHYAQPAAVHAASTDRVVSTLFRDHSGDKNER
jgi:hypothetical protein